MLGRLVFVMTFIVQFMLHLTGAVEVKRCKWSNEGCSTNEDCCSKHCYKAHSGTNARCERSSLAEPCFASYQCEDGLSCGLKYTCCSPYWGVCIVSNDCCDPEHVCRWQEGFHYNRCLYPSGAETVKFQSIFLPQGVYLMMSFVTMHLGYNF